MSDHTIRKDLPKREEIDLLLDTLDEVGILETREKAEKLIAYMDAILDKNKSVNLTAITDRREFISKHLIDSLACARLGAFASEFKRAGRIIDVGTGGGFPGVPLAIVFPEKEFTLVDSLNKRVRIVSEICETLGITNVSTVHGRAEDLARDEAFRDSFDLCVSRAVANMRVLTELCLPFVKTGGAFMAYKGEADRNEVDSAAKAIEALGGELLEIIPQPAGEGMDNHSIVLIKKIAPTDDTYPRRAGIPAKKPL